MALDAITHNRRTTGNLPMFLQVLLTIKQIISLYSRSMWKWVVHQVTGRCELLRIQYDEQPGTSRTHKTEVCLRRSKVEQCRVLPSTKALVDRNVTERVSDVMKVKNILQEKHPVFRPRFQECLEKIIGYQLLCEELEKLRVEKYSEAKHEKQLLELWSTLKPDEPLQERFTRQWGDIGFQGTDPATDFRGMGILGFKNLIHFSKEHTALARRALVHSNHPKYGYSFAIVGINLTEMCLRFMKDGSFKSHFYNMDRRSPLVEDFFEIYCYVFVEFDKLWMREKPNIMQFNEIRNKYEKMLTHQLADSSVCLKMEAGNTADLSTEEF